MIVTFDLFTKYFQPPFDKFGWFVDRNDSYTYDGNFTMFTGSTDISKLGILEMWNDKNVTNLYRGLCDRVKGTTGELWYALSF